MSLWAPCDLIDWVLACALGALWGPLKRSFANQEFTGLRHTEKGPGSCYWSGQ